MRFTVGLVFVLSTVLVSVLQASHSLERNDYVEEVIVIPLQFIT